MSVVINKRIRATNNWDRYRRWSDNPTTVNLVLTAYPRVIGKTWIDYDLLTGLGEMLDTLNYCQTHGLVKAVFKTEKELILTFKTKVLAMAYKGLLNDVIKTYASQSISRLVYIKSGHWDHFYTFERIAGTYSSPVAEEYLKKGFTAGRLRAKIKTTTRSIEKELGGSIALFDMILASSTTSCREP